MIGVQDETGKNKCSLVLYIYIYIHIKRIFRERAKSSMMKIRMEFANVENHRCRVMVTKPYLCTGNNPQAMTYNSLDLRDKIGLVKPLNLLYLCLVLICSRNRIKLGIFRSQKCAIETGRRWRRTSDLRRWQLATRENEPFTQSRFTTSTPAMPASRVAAVSNRFHERFTSRST